MSLNGRNRHGNPADNSSSRLWIQPWTRWSSHGSLRRTLFTIARRSSSTEPPLSSYPARHPERQSARRRTRAACRDAEREGRRSRRRARRRAPPRHRSRRRRGRRRRAESCCSSVYVRPILVCVSGSRRASEVVPVIWSRLKATSSPSRRF